MSSPENPRDDTPEANARRCQQLCLDVRRFIEGHQDEAAWNEEVEKSAATLLDDLKWSILKAHYEPDIAWKILVKTWRIADEQGFEAYRKGLVEDDASIDSWIDIFDARSVARGLRHISKRLVSELPNDESVPKVDPARCQETCRDFIHFLKDQPEDEAEWDEGAKKRAVTFLEELKSQAQKLGENLYDDSTFYDPARKAATEGALDLAGTILCGSWELVDRAGLLRALKSDDDFRDKFNASAIAEGLPRVRHQLLSKDDVRALIEDDASADRARSTTLSTRSKGGAPRKDARAEYIHELKTIKGLSWKVIRKALREENPSWLETKKGKSITLTALKRAYLRWLDRKFGPKDRRATSRRAAPGKS